MEKKDYKLRVLDLLNFYLKEINWRYNKDYHLHQIKSIDINEDWDCCIEFIKIDIKFKRNKKIYKFEVMDDYIKEIVVKIPYYLEEIQKDYINYLKFIGAIDLWK